MDSRDPAHNNVHWRNVIKESSLIALFYYKYQKYWKNISFPTYLYKQKAEKRKRSQLVQKKKKEKYKLYDYSQFLMEKLRSSIKRKTNFQAEGLESNN